ncbi:hypothetical protein [Sinomonas albida]|uniref:hypothetical protein n=1 Tax=Sinomonas albida TaxID=369942 RepID=UPI0010A87FD9|nr:hypothetical protein [Sinomonas albida]
MLAANELATAARRALLGSIVRGTRELADADAAIRRGVPTCRRVNFVGLRGGVGVSTTAASVATILAQRRPRRVLAVDGGASRAVTLLTGADAVPQPLEEAAPSRRRTLPERRPAAATSWEATSALPASPIGLRVVAPEPTGAARQASPAEWRTAVEPITRFFDVAVGDWGRRAPSVDLSAAVDDAHALALVARADRFALEEALAHVGAIHARSGRAPLVVAVDVDDVGPAASRAAGSWGLAPIHFVPFDSRYGTGAGAGAGRPAAQAVREAHIRLAAALIEASLPPSSVAPAEKAEAPA